MNSIFMTKYANLSSINKFNKYASKKIPLCLKRRVEIQIYFQILKNSIIQIQKKQEILKMTFL